MLGPQYRTLLHAKLEVMQQVRKETACQVIVRRFIGRGACNQGLTVPVTGAKGTLDSAERLASVLLALEEVVDTYPAGDENGIGTNSAENDDDEGGISLYSPCGLINGQ